MRQRRREAPYIRRISRRKDATLWLVDGAYVRTNLDEEFSNYSHHFESEYIPKGEIWIDRQVNDDEQQFYVEHAVMEFRLRAQGLPEEEARKRADDAELRARKKAGDVRKMTRGGRLPLPRDFHTRLWKKLQDGVRVWIVDGRLVRSVLDIDFTEGGHEHVYEYVPRDEVWIDDDITDAERPYVLLHELHERNLMRGGMDYERAHAESSKLEKYMRRHPDELHDALSREGWGE